MKPTPASSSAVSWYSGWVRLRGATVAGQAWGGSEGGDWARQSPSSNTPTPAPNTPALPCHLQPLILSHNPMSTGETGGERLGRTQQVYGVITSWHRLCLDASGNDKNTEYNDTFIQGKRIRGLRRNPQTESQRKRSQRSLLQNGNRKKLLLFCRRNATMAFCKWEIQMYILCLRNTVPFKLLCYSFTA